jgi:hypothetical protein
MSMLSSHLLQSKRWQAVVFVLAIAGPSVVILVATILGGNFESRQANSVLFLASGAMGLIVFFQEMYAFYFTNSRRILWMSAGFFTLGIGMIGNAITTGGTLDVTVDSYVSASELFRGTSEFAAAIFILLGTLRSDKSIRENMEFKAYILVAVIMVTAASIIIYISTIQEGLSVPIYSSQYGWSPFSLYIELHVLLFFAVTCTVYVSIRKKNNNSQILFWFIIGFILLTFSELSFTIDKVLDFGVSSSLVWIGRFFLLAGFMTFVMGLNRTR